MPASVIVTGASGFIGSALIMELVARSVKVSAVSRRASPLPAGVTPVIVNDYEGTPPDPAAVIVHLAETADISEVERHGSGYPSEVRGRVAALLKKGYSRFVYISSGRVYDTTCDGLRSPTDPIAPNSIYETAKLAAEDLVRNNNGVVVRLSNVYGPPLKVGTVLSDIVSQIRGTGPVTVHDDNPARDFLWIDDAAKGLADIALGAATGTFNLGSGTATSAAEIARIALDAYGDAERAVVARKPRQQGKTNSIALDITDTASQFGWRPSTPLADGIRTLLQETP